MNLSHVRNHKGVIIAICTCFLLVSLLSGCKGPFNGNRQKSIDIMDSTTSYINRPIETTEEKKENDLKELNINNFKPIKEFFKYDFDVNINGTKEEPLSFTVKGEFDLNMDGSLDKIDLLLQGHLGREKNIQTYIQVDSVKEEIYMDHTSDGEVRIIDLDKNDKFIEIAYFDEGPSGDPAFTFYRYNGTKLYKIGSLPSDVLFDGKDSFIPGCFISKFEPKFYSAWFEIKDNQFVQKDNDIGKYLGKTYKFDGGEAYFIPVEEMPTNFEPKWEEPRQFEAIEMKVNDVYFYSGERNLNYYFVELQNGERGMIYFWSGD